MSKYSNLKTMIQGMEFDSRLESRRFVFLSNWQRLGLIESLCMQVPFNLSLSEEETEDFPDEAERWKGRKYIADFTYERGGDVILEDVKSSWTAANAIFRAKKARLMHMGLYINEILPIHIPFLDLPVSMQYKQRSQRQHIQGIQCLYGSRSWQGSVGFSRET